MTLIVIIKIKHHNELAFLLQTTLFFKILSMQADFFVSGHTKGHSRNYRWNSAEERYLVHLRWADATESTSRANIKITNVGRDAKIY